jgi:hypothetical protein
MWLGRRSAAQPHILMIEQRELIEHREEAAKSHDDNHGGRPGGPGR